LQRLLHAEDPKAYTILNKLGNSVAYKRGGRLLAYVYLPDGTMLNTLLVQEEYAQVMTVFPKVKHQDMFPNKLQIKGFLGRALDYESQRSTGISKAD